MSAKHTPGPWEAERLEASNRLAVTARQSHTVAIVNHNVHIDETVHAANARLIAAAPDLLEALEALVAEQNGPPLLGRHERAWREAMAKAEAAIAKAKGVATSSAGGHPISGGSDA